MKKNIVVVGSSNTDMVIQSEHFPAPGETILGGPFAIHAGGKGANQAVAAARAGGRVSFICQTGDDLFGNQARQQFTTEGIDIRHGQVVSGTASGVALITVDKKGENTIVVAPGANASLSPGHIEKAEALIAGASILLLQLEIPLETVISAAGIASKAGVTVLLNPAPFCQLPQELLSLVNIITPNETEAAALSGTAVVDPDSARKAASVIHDMGVPTVIITRGKQGSLIFHNNEFTEVAALPVAAVDSTAAGDVFSGALAVALAEGKEIQAAAVFASVAAAISVTRRGAQSSAPYRNEINAEYSG